MVVSTCLSSDVACNLQVLIDAIELVWRGSQRSDHVKKAINYVKILLDKQAEPNARDEWGSGSAIHYAIWSGHLDVVKALLDTTTCNIEADTGRETTMPQLHTHLLRCLAACQFLCRLSLEPEVHRMFKLGIGRQMLLLQASTSEGMISTSDRYTWQPTRHGLT